VLEPVAPLATPVATVQTAIETQLDLFGLKFIFDGVRLKLNSRQNYTVEDLLQIGNDVNYCLKHINSNGYVPSNYSLRVIFLKIQNYLINCGCKKPSIEYGTSENTFTL
jgi:hypothetical protein